LIEPSTRDLPRADAPVEAPSARAEAIAFFLQVWAILRKDLLLEGRRRETLAGMAMLALLVIVVFAFALDLADPRTAEVAPGALWVAYLFAGVIGLGRGLALGHDWGTLEGLLLAPIDRAAIYLAKTLGNALFMLATEAACLPVFAVFFGLPTLSPALAPTLILGAVGISAATTLFSALAIRTRARELLLPALTFPLVVPALIAGVEATSEVLAGGDPGRWVGLLVVFDAVFLAVGLIVFDAVLED
jgi:heme exporter protein B